MIAAPGKTESHHAASMYERAVLSIPPHDASGGCVPRPRKLSAASARIALPR